MKYAIGMLCALSAVVANAEQLLVRVGQGHQCAGDVFSIAAPPEVLFLERKCELPITHAADMRAYVFRSGDTAIKGCWGKLLDGNYAVVDQAGSQQVLAMNGYAEAVTTSASTAKIIRSPMQGTAWAKAMGMCP